MKLGWGGLLFLVMNKCETGVGWAVIFGDE